MIKTFRTAITEELFLTGKSRRLPTDIHNSGRRRLRQLDEAAKVSDLRSVGGSLECIDEAASRYSVRVNDRYRVTFRFVNGSAYDVEIQDYHRGGRGKKKVR